MYERVETCPLCGNSSFKNHLVVKDYAVSQESFALVKCSKCSLVFTNPRPDQAVIHRYYQSDDYLSHLGKGHTPMQWIYQLARSFMLHRKLQWIRSLHPGKGKLLDYGCGVGSFLSLAQKKGWDVWGIEPNSKARQLANDNPNFQVAADFQDLPSDISFNVITLWHVMEHLPDLVQTMSALKGKLKTHGYLITAVPNINSLDAQYYKENWAGLDVPRHLYHFTDENIRFLAKKLKMQLHTIIPLKLDAYYISILSEKYIAGSFIKALIQGYKSNQHARKNQQMFSSLVYILKK